MQLRYILLSPFYQIVIKLGRQEDWGGTLWKSADDEEVRGLRAVGEILLLPRPRPQTTVVMHVSPIITWYSDHHHQDPCNTLHPLIINHFNPSAEPNPDS